MSDFDIFVNHVENGNLENVMKSFHPDFMEKIKPEQNKRPIHFACRNGHLDVVKFLIQNQCSIECENKWNYRPIHLACQYGHLNIVKFLIQNQCSIECENYLKWRPIHFASEYGHLEIVKFLIQNQCSIECENEDNYRPIHLACVNGHLEIVKYLVQNRCKLDCRTKDGQTPLELAMKYRRQSCVKLLNEILECRKKIFDCVRRNDAEVLNALCNPAVLAMEEEETGLSLLEIALQSKSNRIIDYFLNKTVNVEEIFSMKSFMKNCSQPEAVQLIQECLLYRSIRFHDADGFHLSCLAKTINENGKLVKSSFLEIAAEYGCYGFINLLLKKSIYKEEEWTQAKNLAILKGHGEIAEAISNREILLMKRADKNFTWLHSAVCDNDPDMMKYILDNNLDKPDSNNEVVGTSLALAHMMCYDKCIEVLEDFMVDVNTQNKVN